MFNTNKKEIVMENRKIFLKGKIYTCQSTTVMCTETTCSYSSETFKGIVIKQTKQLQPSAGTNDEWLCSTFQEETDNITL